QPSGGSTLFLPGQPAGVLPNGVFTVTGSIGAGATAVSGPATFLLQLKDNGTVTYSRTTPVTLVPGTLALNPTHATLFEGETFALNATVGNTPTTSVTWSIQESGGGSVSPTTATSTTYTAPAAPGTYHVKATSTADTTKTATCTITVPAVTVALNQ